MSKTRKSSSRKRPTTNKGDVPIQTVAMISLGCAKNLIDSERMFGQLASQGLIAVSEPSQADALVVNTCGFLDAAREESVAIINEASQLKRTGQLKRIVVAGCLVQRHRAKLLQWCPDIDALIGVFDRDRIVTAVQGSQPSASNPLGSPDEIPVYSSIAANATLAARDRNLDNPLGYFESDSARLRLTPRHYAFLRISEGCNQNCAFCTIPSIRGKMRSKPAPAILAEAHELLSDGAFELNLIGQDTTSYGSDIDYQQGLPGILTELNNLARSHGSAWLRLMYAYPSCFTDQMIDAIAQLPHVLKYIDMPLQHINDRILTLMKRNTSRKLIEHLLDKLRKKVPGIAIRTTMISGFPTETDAEHRELLDFIRDFGFDHLGVFPYSPEDNTPAARLYHDRGSIDPQIIDQRIEQLMLAQQQVVFTRQQQWASDNQPIDVLIESSSDETAEYIGRAKHQAPDIDSVTFVQSQASFAPGEVVPCQIIATRDYDLIATPVSNN